MDCLRVIDFFASKDYVVLGMVLRLRMPTPADGTLDFLGRACFVDIDLLSWLASLVVPKVAEGFLRSDFVAKLLPVGVLLVIDLLGMRDLDVLDSVEEVCCLSVRPSRSMGLSDFLTLMLVIWLLKSPERLAVTEMRSSDVLFLPLRTNGSPVRLYLLLSLVRLLGTPLLKWTFLDMLSALIF